MMIDPRNDILVSKRMCRYAREQGDGRLHSVITAKQRIEGFRSEFEATRHSGHMSTARRWREKYKGMQRAEGRTEGRVGNENRVSQHKTIGAEGGRRSEIPAISVGVSMRKSGDRKTCTPRHFQQYLPELSVLPLHGLQATPAEARTMLLKVFQSTTQLP